jgi:hypothetical protein
MDFGRVRVSESALELGFTVINHGSRAIEIKELRAGCGCTVAELPHSIVQPNERLSIPVKVSTRGRLGAFSNVVSVRIAQRALPIRVPIRGLIVNDIWYNGQTARCTADPGNRVGTGFFEVMTSDYPLVRFDLSGLDPDVSVAEVARTRHEDLTVIKFRFSVKLRADRNSAGNVISLKPRDKHINSLAIPVVCYSPTRNDGTTFGSEELWPQRVGIGVIQAGDERRVRLFGERSILNSLQVIGLDGVPQGINAELTPEVTRDGRSRVVILRATKLISAGLFTCRVRLRASGKREFLVTVVGAVRPLSG